MTALRDSYRQDAQIDDPGFWHQSSVAVVGPPQGKTTIARRLPTICKPVLIVHGAQDAIVKPAVVDQHRAGLAHAEVEMMSNAGPAGFWDDPARFNERLQAFCERLELEPVS